MRALGLWRQAARFPRAGWSQSARGSSSTRGCDRKGAMGYSCAGGDMNGGWHPRGLYTLARVPPRNGILGASRDTLQHGFKRGLFFDSLNPFAVAPKTDMPSASTHAARKHHERRLVPFSPDELYRVVLDVGQYKNFVPWCVESHVIRADETTHEMEAKLKVGFRVFSEEYTSVINYVPRSSVRVRAVNSSLFKHLVNEWRFKPGPDKHSAWLDFMVDFQFKNTLYQGASNLFFDEVCKKMVESFENRCMDLYNRSTRYTRGPSRRF
ncbi:Coenzyme Q-binding protein COQ10-like, mitochondrial [Porphyridium purpureum]|uniref:Coenzyme Q-binding protein COQ10-like, mitochondrial n=1 Tax=Porphyridium purpureum TaxID=35688 RepID=A0A5J4Z647_PORPP|nr:Coenzyme Q-binding protein COQ10-like, mitochondrial [Porphyridium purpureum]|eukprot:POR3616..scf295_1